MSKSKHTLCFMPLGVDFGCNEIHVGVSAGLALGLKLDRTEESYDLMLAAAAKVLETQMSLCKHASI